MEIFEAMIPTLEKAVDEKRTLLTSLLDLTFDESSSSFEIHARITHEMTEANLGKNKYKKCLKLYQSYQKETITKYYEDIKDYDYYMESTQLSSHPFALKSLCFLLEFIWQHNANLTNKLQRPKFDNMGNKLLLANHSLRQLNIVNIGNNKGQYSSVENLINKCVTPMGKRYLKDKILHPVTDVKYLNEQYKMIEY